MVWSDTYKSAIDGLCRPVRLYLKAKCHCVRQIPSSTRSSTLVILAGRIVQICVANIGSDL